MSKISSISMMNRKDIMKGMKLLSLLALLAVFILAGKTVSASAASVEVTKVDYDRSEMTVKLNPSDTLLLASDAKAKKWEILAERENTDEVTFDISWITLTKDYVLSLKGDASEDIVKLTLPKQSKTFKVSYFVADTSVNFSNADGREVEWRKKESLSWQNYNEATFADELSSFCANGATIFFRLKQEMGLHGLAGERPSKEVSITVPKKTAAPDVKINDNNLTIALEKGTQYRYLQSETGNPVVDPATGQYADWLEIPKTTSYPLESLAPRSLYREGSTMEKTYIQFRTKATSSRQMSNTTTIVVPTQQPVPQNDDNQIELKYTSSTTFQLTVKAASSAEPYQYCVIDSKTFGTTSITAVEAADLTWKDITSTNPVKFDKDSDKIEEGTKLYVRKKAVNSQGNADYKLASPAINISGDSGIVYPGNAAVTEAGEGIIWLQTIAGVCNSGNSEGSLQFLMYSPTETTIKSLEFVDYDNLASIGTVSVTSSVAKNSHPTSDKGQDKYIITTTIKSTASVDSCTRKRMLAYITYDSGAVFKSTRTEGIGLYIYPETKVDNPDDDTEKTRIGKLFNSSYSIDDDHIDYSTAFERVFLSNKVRDGVTYNYETEDKRDFKFLLKLGSVYSKTRGILGGSETPDLTYDEYDAKAAGLAAISRIKYDSVELPADSYTVEYAIDKDSENHDIRLALVTVHCNVLEQIATIDDRNKDTNLIVYLNNGEILNKQITLNLVKTATIDASPVSWALTPSTLETEKTVTTTAANGSTTSTTEKVYDYIIDMTLFKSTYSVAISDVTWNGISVYDKAEVGNGKIKLYLSNAKLKAIEETGTHNLVISFTNGFRITDDCQMTLLNR